MMTIHRDGPLISLVWPGGLMLLIGLAFLRPAGLPAWVHPLIHALPYAVLVFGLLLCWLLDHSRIGLSLLVFFIGDQAFLAIPGSSDIRIQLSDSILQLAGFLIPLNLLALNLVRHDGIFSRTTLLWIIFILLEATVAGWLVYFHPTMTGAALNIAFLPPALTTWSHLTQPAMLAMGSALTLQVTHAHMTDSEIEKGFVWAYIAVLIALYSFQVGWEPRPFLALAGLIIVMSLMQASYRSAFRDEITRLPGPRAFEMASQRLGRRYSLAIVEIDQLKEINNHYGRGVADQILALVAKTLIRAGGKGKVFAHGGEHFLVLFPATSPQNALVSLERIRKAVEAACFVMDHRKLVRGVRRPISLSDSASEDLSLTVSIGLCGTDHGVVMLPGIVKTAYEAVHGATSEGGNIVRRLAMEHQRSAGLSKPNPPAAHSVHRQAIFSPSQHYP
jgi:diguanylate cyclase (GGDEF)-like protein